MKRVRGRLPTARPPILLTAVVLMSAACKPAGEGVIALEGATLIDGSGSEPVKDALILVKDGHIEAVARVNEVAVPRGAHEINLIGKTVTSNVPGTQSGSRTIGYAAIPLIGSTQVPRTLLAPTSPTNS